MNDLVRDGLTETAQDVSNSVAYARALSLLVYHGVLSVREKLDRLAVLGPPKLLSSFDHYLNL